MPYTRVVSDVHFLRDAPLFSGLDERDLEQLLIVCEHRTFVSGKRLFHQGDDCDGLYVLTRGEVRISILSQGQELIFSVLKAGETFGELALLDGQRRSADATAVGEAAVVVVPREAFLTFVASRPRVGAQLLAVLSGRLRASDETLRGLATKNANEAVAEALTFGDRIADLIARFGGSWWFIGAFSALVALWMGLNLIPSAKKFDEYPFQFLNLVLAILAALQAPIIMMSQNRQSAKDKIQSDLDYQVNLKNELQIKRLHEKLDSMHAAQLAEIRDLKREDGSQRTA